ncbi:MAG TPA: hypothetical protein VIX62_00935 [Actinomycetota bacterium]
MKLLQRTISIVLTVVGAALLAMGTVLWWADGHLFDTATVVAQTDDVLTSPDVQVLLTARITDHVMVYVGDQTFRPQVEMIVEEAVADPRVRALVNDGVRQTHLALVSGDAEQVALRLEALSREIRQTVVATVPELAGRIPDTDVLTFDLITRSDLPDVWRLAERFHEAAAMFLSIGAVLVGVGLVIGPARWLRLLVGGLTFAAFGVVCFVALRAAITVVEDRITDPLAAAAAGDIFDAFFSSLDTRAIVMVIGGLLAAMFGVAIRLMRPEYELHTRRASPFR